MNIIKQTKLIFLCIFIYSYTPKVFMEAIQVHAMTQSQYNAAISPFFEGRI